MKNYIKKAFRIVLFILLFVFVSGFITFKFIYGPFVEGNDPKYNVANTAELKNSPIAGKVFYFLGSSVTLGYASENESFVDFIRKRNRCICVKNAVSGTTLMDNGDKSYVKRIKEFDTHTKINAFVCQLSTNDIRLNRIQKLGTISDSTKGKDYDVSTTIGAIEFIISYVKNTWNCPVVFYTNSYFGDQNYERLIGELYKIKSRYNIDIIDLYNDKDLNNVTKEQLNLYMAADRVHPYKAGYKMWWTPVIEKRLYDIVSSEKKD